MSKRGFKYRVADGRAILHEGEKGLSAPSLDMESRQPREIHPEQFVVHPDTAHHDLQLVQVGAGLAQSVQLDGIVHPADLQHLQVGARVAEEKSLQVCRVVLVVKVQVEF